MRYLLLGLLFFCSCKATRMQSITFSKNPVIAHRGAWKAKGHPENSIASLREAIALGCTGSEFDVRMSADDSLIINHDPHFQGMDIEKSSFAQLRTKTLTNGEPLPTLRDYLLAGMKDNTTTRLIVEIKPSEVNKERGRKIAGLVHKLIHDLNANAYVVYISFDYDILLELRRLDPAANLQYLEGNKAPSQVAADKINGLDYHFSVFQRNPEWVNEAKSKGLALNAWTVNEEVDMKRLLGQGFDYITTNEPEACLKLAAH